jgi:hypothetical protein
MWAGPGGAVLGERYRAAEKAAVIPVKNVKEAEQYERDFNLENSAFMHTFPNTPGSAITPEQRPVDGIIL